MNVWRDIKTARLITCTSLSSSESNVESRDLYGGSLSMPNLLAVYSTIRDPVQKAESGTSQFLEADRASLRYLGQRMIESPI
jgi:hypothetical protein